MICHDSTVVSTKKSSGKVMTISYIASPRLKFTRRVLHVTDDEYVDGYQANWQ